MSTTPRHDVLVSTERVSSVLSRVRSLGPEPHIYQHRGQPTPFALTCVVEPPTPWDRTVFEKSLGVVLPDHVCQFWTETGGARLFEDREYGQWGLVLWSPEVALARTIAERSERPLEYEADLVLGEFLGDAELLVVSCSPSTQDLGRVHVALPLDPRADWESPAGSVAEFLSLYVAAQGDKFWEVAIKR